MLFYPLWLAKVTEQSKSRSFPCSVTEAKENSNYSSVGAIDNVTKDQRTKIQ